MLRNKVTKAFFTLLRAGLWNQPIDQTACFPLSDEEWNTLFRMAIHQTVEGIVFDGIQQLPTENFPPRSLLLKWLVRVEKIEQRNTWMDAIITEQYAFFEQEGLHPLLLKGQGLARCYMNPRRRVCGDVDWYFSTKEAYSKATQRLNDQQIAIQHTSGISSSYLWKGCEMDHHRRLFDIHNPLCRRYLQNLEHRESQKGAHFSIQGVHIALPTPLVQVLQVNMHILKHLLAFGIGIRQLCDAARLYHTYRQQLDSTNLQATYIKLNIMKWINLLHAVLVKFIGLSENDLPFPIKKEHSADWMMEEIIKSGNFGFHDSRYKKNPQEQLPARAHTAQRLWNNFMKYVPYAPLEALSFPWVHFYSKLSK